MPLAPVYGKKVIILSLKEIFTMAELVIDITCPSCQTTFKKKAKDLKKGAVVKCPKCADSTTIQDDYFTEMLKNLEKGN